MKTLFQSVITAVTALSTMQTDAAPSAYITVTDNHVVVGNQFLERGLDLDNDSVWTAYLENKLTKKRMPIDSSEFTIRLDDTTELTQRDFCLTAAPNVIDLPIGGKQVVFSLNNDKLNLQVKLMYELLNDDFYTRKWLEITMPPEPHLLNTVDIERLRMDGASLSIAGPAPGKSDQYQERLTVRLGQPVFADNFFLGVEYPAAEDSISPEGWITLRQYVGRKLEQQTWASQKAVIGVAPDTPLDRVGDWFQKYIDRIRVAPIRRVIQWQSWWTTKKPTEEKTLMMIDKVKEGFLDKGIPLSLFLLDAHWQVPGWDINPQSFPHGFEPIKKRLAEIGLPMGLWMGLTDGGGDRPWCEAHGYETTDKGQPCFAGPRWGKHVRNQLLRYIKDYDLASWKTDYTLYTCEKTDHGHLGGLYSVSAHADMMIDLQREIRRMKPGFYAFDGFWMSPWWLMHVDTIWPDLTDFLVEEMFPGTNSRDAQITSRDAYIYRRLKIDKFQVPLHSWMTCEPIRAATPESFRKMDATEAPLNDTPPFYRDEDPLDRWTNNIVMHVCRGNGLTELYVSPWLLDGGYGDHLRDVLKWGLEHNDILLPETRMILGDPRKLQIYGYAHFPRGLHRGIIGLRNPAFDAQSAEIALDESAGVADSPEEYVMEVVYPYRKTFDRTFRYGDKVQCPLEGYQTLVLEATAVQSLSEPMIVGASCRIIERTQDKIAYELLGSPGSVQSCRIAGMNENASASIDNQNIPLDEHAQFSVTFPGQADELIAKKSDAPDELVVQVPEGYANPSLTILCRGKKTRQVTCTMTNNGQPMTLKSVKPNRSCYHVQPAQTWQFFLGKLDVGENRLNYTLSSGDEKIAAKATIAAEAPQETARLELRCSGTGVINKQETQLPLMYREYHKQVVELDLITLSGTK